MFVVVVFGPKSGLSQNKLSRVAPKVVRKWSPSKSRSMGSVISIRYSLYRCHSVGIRERTGRNLDHRTPYPPLRTSQKCTFVCVLCAIASGKEKLYVINFPLVWFFVVCVRAWQDHQEGRNPRAARGVKLVRWSSPCLGLLGFCHRSRNRKDQFQIFARSVIDVASNNWAGCCRRRRCRSGHAWSLI